MSHEVRQKHGDITYVYQSESYRDPVTKKPKSKRKLIGKVDPVTGNVVPTGRSGRKAKSPAEGADTEETLKYYKSLSEKMGRELADKDRKILALQETVRELEEKVKAGEKKLEKIRQSLAEAERLAGG